MPSLTTYSKGEVIKHLFRSGSMAKPSGLFVALFVGATEVSGGSYTRIQHGPGDAYWTDQTSGNGRTANIGAIAFPAPTGNWGVVTGFKLMDAETGGNALVSGNLIAAKTINTGDPSPTFADGVLVGILT